MSQTLQWTQVSLKSVVIERQVRVQATIARVDHLVIRNGIGRGSRESQPEVASSLRINSVERGRDVMRFGWLIPVLPHPK